MAIHALVVEDDQLIINDVEERLDSLGHTYDCVGTQQEARERLDGGSFSYILLDLGLPLTFGRSPRVENGLNLLNYITETGRADRVPVIVMTAHGHDGPDLAVEVLRYGRAIDFIKKPFGSNVEPFETKVTRALERAGVLSPVNGRSTTRRSKRETPPDDFPRLNPPVPDLTWEEVTFTMKDGHTVAVRVRGESRLYTYCEIGLRDRRSRKPTVQWKFLGVLGETQGVLDWSSQWADRKNQKRRERLAADLMAFFGIDEDPFLLTKDGKGWRTRFAIAKEQ